MMRQHSSPLLLILGVVIAWASIRTAIMIADEMGSRLATADRPLRLQPRASAPLVRVAGPALPFRSMDDLRRPSQRRDRVSSAPVYLRTARGSTVQENPALLSLMPGPAGWLPEAVPAPAGAIEPTGIERTSLQPAMLANPSSRQPKAGSHADRWAFSTWAYVRPDRQAGQRFDLARLGGSQFGLRVARRLDRDGQINGFARLVSIGSMGDGLEGAAGLALRPSQNLPVALVIERREQLAGTGGRSAFAAYATGGASNVPLSQGLTLDVYGAAGVVGAARRDMFAEGSAVLSLRPVSAAGVDVVAGAGAWGAAQPGVSRLDIGPRLSAYLPIGGARPMLAIDWRQRVAGQAAPSSGLALTLAADF